MLSMVLAATLVADSNRFFPLNAGDTYVYVERAENNSQNFTDVVGEPFDLEGYRVYPISTRSGSQVVDTAYYSVDKDSVKIVAYSDRIPMAIPYSVLELKDGRGTAWSYSGTTMFLGAEDTMSFRATSRTLGRRDVLGQQREVVEVRMDIVLSEGAFTSVQTSLYAEGVGLYEMREVSKVGTRSITRSRELVRYQPASRSSDRN